MSHPPPPPPSSHRSFPCSLSEAQIHCIHSSFYNISFSFAIYSPAFCSLPLWKWSLWAGWSWCLEPVSLSSMRSDSWSLFSLTHWINCLRTAHLKRPTQAPRNPGKRFIYCRTFNVMTEPYRAQAGGDGDGITSYCWLKTQDRVRAIKYLWILFFFYVLQTLLFFWPYL